jgi:hypothetical protein
MRCITREGTHLPRHITEARPLDLDDLGPKPGEQLGTERASHVLAEVEYTHIAQGEVIFRHRSSLPID